jgi:hypothetical protein
MTRVSRSHGHFRSLPRLHLSRREDSQCVFAEAGSANGFVGAYLVGDSNLDGIVNVADLNALAVAWQTNNNNWSSGNYTGSGSNVADFNALALNWQSSVPVAAAVPEPSSALVLTLGLLAVFGLRRKCAK